MNSRGFAALLLASLLILSPIEFASAQQENNSDTPPVDAPKEENKEKNPQPKITVSKETTRIEGPLTEDGYVDYIEALNLRFSRGVTPENNAADLLWKAIGPEAGAAEFRVEVYRRLGLDLADNEGNHLVSGMQIVKREIERRKPQPEFAVLMESFNNQQSAAMQRPWGMGDHPLIALWLEANEQPLKLIFEATKRPRMYSPIIAGEDGRVIEVLLLHVQQCREFARLLSARAMFNLGTGRVEQAWQDSLAIHRLARLTGQGFSLIEMLVGVALDGIACHLDHQIALSDRLTVEQALRYQAELAKLPPLPSVADILDVGERYAYLDAAQSLARHGTDALGGIVGDAGGEHPLDGVIKSLAKSLVDWNLVMRMGNDEYDRLVEAARKPSHAESLAAMEKVFADINARVKEARSPLSTLAKAIFGGKPAATVAGEHIGLVLTSLILPATQAATSARYRADAVLNLTQLSFGLAAYRKDHGEYPDKLDELVPKYFDALPKDPFTGEQLRYKKKGGGFLAYSVGADQEDDEGRGPLSGDAEGDDFAIGTPDLQP